MTHFASARIVSYAGVAAFALLVGLAAGRLELVALAAPFALAAAVGASLGRNPEVSAELVLDRDRALEGEEVRLRVELRAPAAVDRIDLLVQVPDELQPARGAPRSVTLPQARTVELALPCRRWGAFAVGPLLLRAGDRLGFHRWEARAGAAQPLRVYPSVETLRSLLSPLETQAFIGNQLSRAKSDGIEFADIRGWTPGDRVRSINWRATARRGELQVNQQHPERNADVVLFLDTFTDIREGMRGTLDLTVRAAASLAHRYLQRKDRVGIVSFGGYASWLLPSSGTRQLYRIVDSLLQMDIVLSFAMKGIEILPPRTLPPKALVLALTPLLDRRSAGALLDLRARGFDLVVIEVSPLPFVDPGRDERARLAYRLWRLSREALRLRYVQAGVPVVEWSDGEALDAVLEEVTAFRRFAKPARA